MARYRVSHAVTRNTWIHKNPDGTFRWDEGSKQAELFPNYKTAKAALDSLPIEKLMYNVDYRTKCTFMKFYDSDEHYKQEQAYYLENKRLLRDWGY